MPDMLSLEPINCELRGMAISFELARIDGNSDKRVRARAGENDGKMRIKHQKERNKQTNDNGGTKKKKSFDTIMSNA